MNISVDKLNSIVKIYITIINMNNNKFIKYVSHCVSHDNILLRSVPSLRTKKRVHIKSKHFFKCK